MARPDVNRRYFLKTALAAGALVAVDGPRALARAGSLQPVLRSHFASTPALLQTRRFAPVQVAANRIIRTVVGLRPFRDEGFVVDAERLGDKLLVHNYGHGGAGVTLSWGTSSLAVDIARDFLQTRTMPNAVTGEGRPRVAPRISRRTPVRFAVLGCGVIGLTTALLLQRRLQGEGVTVTIYAKDLPPQTTSNIAGAWWSPTSVYESESVSAKFLAQFRLACRISHRAFQELVGPEYGVRWIDTFELFVSESSLERGPSGGASLYPQIQVHRDPKHYFGFPFVRQFNSMLIEPHTYLRALLGDFYVAGGKVVVKEFKTREEIGRLREQVVFNCTGLGAKQLFGDEKLRPIRGQLEILLPQAEIDYCYRSDLGYMFPRRDGIVLGGTFDYDNWSLEANAEDRAGILEGHTNIMKGMATEWSLNRTGRADDSGRLRGASSVT